MNAAQRFLAASRERDPEAAMAQLADDVVMFNPASDEPVVGKEAVGAALRMVEHACDEFRHTHLLSDASDERRFGLVFEARIGDAHLQGVDLLQLDDTDRISTFTVMVRPVSGLMALGARMSGGSSPPAG